MKITKTKKTVIEDIDVQPGSYFFQDENAMYSKLVLGESEDDYSKFTLEILTNFSDVWGIRFREDGAWDESDLPYGFRQFILGVGGKKIEKEEYYKERAEILEKLNV